MSSIEEVLKKFYEENDTGDLSVIFKSYMNEIGARKIDRRRKDNSNTFDVDGDCYSWNKVECSYYKNDHETYGDSDLEVVFRKRQGSYLIVSRGLERAYEISYGKIITYNEKLMAEIMKDHAGLFAKMCC